MVTGWLDRVICLIFRHDILWGRTIEGKFVKVRCMFCGKRWES